MTRKQINNQMREGRESGRIHGFVRVHLSDVIDNDLEGFLDILSEKLTGSLLLMDINYNIDHTEDDDLILYVTGDASEIIEIED